MRRRCSTPIASMPRRSTKDARSPRRRNGWSTTIISSRSRSARSDRDLPPGYYRQLPKLVEGPFAGYPRVFGVAWAFVAHTDSRFDPETLCRFVHAYQQTQPLTIGELWAVAITLRIVLVENLRRLAERIVFSRAARQEADGLANRLLGAAALAAESVSVVLADLDRAPLPDAFAVQLVHRLRDQDPRITPALTWLDERLAAQGTTADAVVRDEHQRQGAANVTVRNIITSMRLISDVDWTELFERSQPCRCDACRRRRLFGHGFSDPQSLSQRHRGTGPRLRPHRDRDRAQGRPGAQSGRCRRSSDGDQRAPGGSRLSPPRREDAARSRLRSAIGRRCAAWLGRFSQSVGIGGYLSAIGVVAVALARPARVRRGRERPRRRMAGPALRTGGDTRHRRGGRAGEPRRDTGLSARRFACFGASRRRSAAPAHDGRGADDAHDPRGDRGAG